MDIITKITRLQMVRRGYLFSLLEYLEKNPYDIIKFKTELFILLYDLHISSPYLFFIFF